MLRAGHLRISEQIFLPRDAEFAVWSEKRLREMVVVPRGVYTCVLLWQAPTGNEGVATLFSPKLVFRGIIVDTFFDHTPGRNIMTLVPFLVDDEVIEIRTGKRKKISEVFLHKDHSEHHYAFVRTCTRCKRLVPADDLSDCIMGKEVEGAGTEPHIFEDVKDLRWHHELKKVTKPDEGPKGLEDQHERKDSARNTEEAPGNQGSESPPQGDASS